VRRFCEKRQRAKKYFKKEKANLVKDWLLTVNIFRIIYSGQNPLSVPAQEL